MSDEIQKGVDEFFKISDKDKEAIENRVKQEKDQWYNKLNPFKKKETNEKKTDKESKTIQQESVLNSQEKSNQTMSFSDTLSLLNRVYTFSIMFLKNAFQGISNFLSRFKGTTGFKINYRWVILLLIIFLLCVYFGNKIFSPEKPPLILD
jgi:hypothetical protein